MSRASNNQKRAAHILYAPPGANVKAGARMMLTFDEVKEMILSGYVMYIEDEMIRPRENAMLKRRAREWR